MYIIFIVINSPVNIFAQCHSFNLWWLLDSIGSGVLVAPREPDAAAPGEMGRPVILPTNISAQTKKLVDDGWLNNAFNQYVSDLISVHRSLPDPRDQWWVIFIYIILASSKLMIYLLLFNIINCFLLFSFEKIITYQRCVSVYNGSFITNGPEKDTCDLLRSKTRSVARLSARYLPSEKTTNVRKVNVKNKRETGV